MAPNHTRSTVCARTGLPSASGGALVNTVLLDLTWNNVMFIAELPFSDRQMR